MTLHTKKTLAFFSTSPLMFKVPQAHNSHRKLFINGLKTKIGENLRSGSHRKCVLFFAGSTVCIICMYVCMHMYACMHPCMHACMHIKNRIISSYHLIYVYTLWYILRQI